MNSQCDGNATIVLCVDFRTAADTLHALSDTAQAIARAQQSDGIAVIADADDQIIAFVLNADVCPPGIAVF